MSKKLLIVVSSIAFFLSHRLTLAKAALASGYEVHVAIPDSSSRDQEVNHYGLQYHRIFMNRGGFNPLQDGISLWSLYRLYRSVKPDIVHHVTMKPILYGSLAARWARVPAVINAVSGLGYLFIANGWWIKRVRAVVKQCLKWALRYPRRYVIFQNEHDRQQFLHEQLLEEQSTFLIRGSGVDMHEFPYTSELLGTPIVLMASRLLWDKGVGEFVAAARYIQQQKNLSVRFVLVGGRDPANPAVISHRQLKRWCEEHCIEYWGERTDMPQVMQAAHIVCLPSYREGLPRVLVEAAAIGRAIVTTDTPGCRDVVRDGENGLLVPVKNVEQLVHALMTLLQNPVLRQTMGRRGRALVEKEYALEVILQQTLAIYQTL